MSDTEYPFPLAYLDWCKKQGVKSLAETEDRDLIARFYREEWSDTGKPVDGIEYAIALGAL